MRQTERNRQEKKGKEKEKEWKKRRIFLKKLLPTEDGTVPQYLHFSDEAKAWNAISSYKVKSYQRSITTETCKTQRIQLPFISFNFENSLSKFSKSPPPVVRLASSWMSRSNMGSAMRICHTVFMYVLNTQNPTAMSLAWTQVTTEQGPSTGQL